MARSKKRARRIRRKPEEIEGILEAYDGWDFTLREFAESHGLPLSTVTGWLRKRRKQQANAERFIEVVEVGATEEIQNQRHDGADSGNFELAFERPGPHGVSTLRVGRGFDARDLNSLLEVLAQNRGNPVGGR